MKKNDDFEAQMKLNELLLHAVEGDMTPAQIEILNELIIRRPELAKHYLEFMNLYCELSPYGDIGYISLAGGDSETQKYDQLLNVLGREEKQAESIQIETETVEVPLEKVLIRGSNAVRNSRQIKHSAAGIIMSVAAILLLVLFLRITPPASVEVATLSQSLNAVFAGNVSYEDGSRLSNAADSLWLQKGVVTIEFDYGAEVVIEAPAEFSLNSPEDMTLRYGRLYARVPGRSKGFTIETPIAQIIDLGTEFAVKVDYDQTCEVHMIKGNASLIPGLKGQSTGESRLLGANEATYVNRSGVVKDIPVKTTDFIREIDPETKFVWRGHTRVCLADIVGGGSGFGDGKPEYGINPETGVTAYRDRERGKNSSYQGFQPVEDNSFVDGVFCPMQDSAAIQVSTEGHVFDGCPLTTGKHWGYVMNSGWFGQSSRQGVFNSNLSLEGTVYGSNAFPAITLHSNLGVTFDLDAIRQSIGHLGIDRFTALCGISELVLEESDYQAIPKASFYVLLDGVNVFERVDATPTEGAGRIDVAIPATTRFLTLMVTEGSDRTYDGDWTLFAEPMLHLMKLDY